MQAATPFEAGREEVREQQRHQSPQLEEAEDPHQHEMDVAHPASHAMDPDVEKGNDSTTYRPHSLELTRTVSTRLSRVASRLTTRDITDPGPPPDGGLKAWTQVAMAFAITSSTWGYVNSFGVFQTYYTTALAESASTVSWIGSLQLWVLFFMSTFSGRALDAGLYTPTLWVGTVVQLVGIFMSSMCTNLWQLLLAQGLCTGIGSGILFCPTLGLVTTYFSRNKGIAVAVVVSAFNHSSSGLQPRTTADRETRPVATPSAGPYIPSWLATCWSLSALPGLSGS